MKLSTTLSLGMATALACIGPVLAACGGGQPAPQTPPTPSAEASASAAPTTTETTAPSASASAPQVAWKDMNHDQRMDYMKNVVYPKMKADFQAFDAKDFGDFTCRTCHGAGAKDGSFKMPNPDLPKLDVAGGMKKEMAEHPDVMKFMGEKVKPEMAQLLGESEWTPQNKEGFGCLDCHTAAQ